MKFTEQCFNMMANGDGAICQNCGREVCPDTERDKCGICQFAPACPPEGCEAWDNLMLFT